MSDLQTLFIVLGVFAFTVFMVAVFMPRLKERGVDLGAALESAKDIVDTATDAIALVRPFLKGEPVADMLGKIVAAATSASATPSSSTLSENLILAGAKKRRGPMSSTC
jgi:hypothetical protein